MPEDTNPSLTRFQRFRRAASTIGLFSGFWVSTIDRLFYDFHPAIGILFGTLVLGLMLWGALRPEPFKDSLEVIAAQVDWSFALKLSWALISGYLMLIWWPLGDWTRLTASQVGELGAVLLLSPFLIVVIRAQLCDATSH